MNSDKTNSAGTTQTDAIEKPLSYAEFSQLLARYKRAVYESIQQAPDPIKQLLEL